MIYAPPPLETEDPRLAMGHLYRTHSPPSPPPPPPPPPRRHHSRSLPRLHGPHRHGARFTAQPPMRPSMELGQPLHPAHHFSSHLEGSSWPPMASQEQFLPPHHGMGGGHLDRLHRRGQFFPHEMGGAHHRHDQHLSGQFLPHVVGGAHHRRHVVGGAHHRRQSPFGHPRYPPPRYHEGTLASPGRVEMVGAEEPPSFYSPPAWAGAVESPPFYPPPAWASAQLADAHRPLVAA